MKQYAVVACPDCEFACVVKLSNKTMKCGRCGKQHQMKKLKKFVETDNMKKAQLVVSEIKAKQAGLDDEFSELLEEGRLSLESYEGLSGPADWVSEDTNESDTRSDKQIVLDVIESCDDATTDAVVSKAVSEGVEGEDAVRRLLERLRRQTEVVYNRDDGYRVL